jgi:hypothetical protein
MPTSSIDSSSSRITSIISATFQQRYLALLALILAVVVASLVVCSPSASTEASLPAECDELDRTASASFVRLVSDRSPVAEARLSDAVQRLRRARKNCRHGLVGIAHRDYEALLKGHTAAYNRYR